MIFIKNDSTSLWQKVKPFIKVDSDWKKLTSIQVKENGIWKVVYRGLDIILLTKQFDGYTTLITTIPISLILDGAIDQFSNNQDPLTLISVRDPLNGAITISGSNILFTSTSSPSQAASFSYTVQNSIGKQKTGTVIMNIITIPDIICNSDTYNLRQNESVIISKASLLANDIDYSNGGALTITSIDNALNGNIIVNGDNITFTSTGISGQPAGFNYHVINALSKTQTGTVYFNITPLPDIEALIYSNTAAFNNAISTMTPPTQETIFNSWARFNGATYYANLAAAAGDSNASAWTLNGGQIYMPLNVDPTNGFISPEILDDYTLECTMTSNYADNDSNGLIIAFNRVGGVNHVLALMVSGGGANPTGGYALVYFQNTSGYSNTGILASSTYLGTRGNWANVEIRLKVQRQGNIITCYGTLWNDVNNYQSSSKIVFDLNSNSSTTQFLGKKPYGYLTFSQPYSTYKNIKLIGALNYNEMYNFETGMVVQYINGAWVETTETIQDRLGYIRTVTNPLTGESFIIKENTIEYLGIV